MPVPSFGDIDEVMWIQEEMDRRLGSPGSRPGSHTTSKPNSRSTSPMVFQVENNFQMERKVEKKSQMERNFPMDKKMHPSQNRSVSCVSHYQKMADLEMVSESIKELQMELVEEMNGYRQLVEEEEVSARRVLVRATTLGLKDVMLARKRRKQRFLTLETSERKHRLDVKRQEALAWEPLAIQFAEGLQEVLEAAFKGLLEEEESARIQLKSLEDLAQWKINNEHADTLCRVAFLNLQAKEKERLKCVQEALDRQVQEEILKRKRIAFDERAARIRLRKTIARTQNDALTMALLSLPDVDEPLSPVEPEVHVHAEIRERPKVHVSEVHERPKVHIPKVYVLPEVHSNHSKTTRPPDTTPETQQTQTTKHADTALETQHIQEMEYLEKSLSKAEMNKRKQIINAEETTRHCMNQGLRRKLESLAGQEKLTAILEMEHEAREAIIQMEDGAWKRLLVRAHASRKRWVHLNKSRKNSDANGMVNHRRGSRVWAHGTGSDIFSALEESLDSICTNTSNVHNSTPSNTGSTSHGSVSFTQSVAPTSSMNVSPEVSSSCASMSMPPEPTRAPPDPTPTQAPPEHTQTPPKLTRTTPEPTHTPTRLTRTPEPYAYTASMLPATQRCPSSNPPPSGATGNTSSLSSSNHPTSGVTGTTSSLSSSNCPPPSGAKGATSSFASYPAAVVSKSSRHVARHRQLFSAQRQLQDVEDFEKESRSALVKAEKMEAVSLFSFGKDLDYMMQATQTRGKRLNQALSRDIQTSERRMRQKIGIEEDRERDGIEELKLREKLNRLYIKNWKQSMQ